VAVPCSFRRHAGHSGGIVPRPTARRGMMGTVQRVRRGSSSSSSSSSFVDYGDGLKGAILLAALGTVSRTTRMTMPIPRPADSGPGRTRGGNVPSELPPRLFEAQHRAPSPASSARSGAAKAADPDVPPGPCRGGDLSLGRWRPPPSPRCCCSFRRLSSVPPPPAPPGSVRCCRCFTLGRAHSLSAQTRTRRKSG
jgi:hypothetical protein